MKRRDSQIDPFNAGEPELPWESPDAYGDHDEDACELPDHSYESPTKAPDDYDAPDDAPAQKPAEPEQPTNRRASRPAPTRESTPAPVSTPKRKRGCGCLVLILIVIAINVLLPTLALIPHCTGIMLEDDAVELTWDASDSYEDEEREEDEAEIEALAEDTLDTVTAPESPARSLIASHFEQDFQQNLGYTVQDLGIDTDDYVEWALTGFDYDITDVFAFDDSEGWGEAYGSVYFDATTPDIFAFKDSFYAAAHEFLAQNNLIGIDVMPNDAQRASFQALFDEQLDAFRTTVTTTSTANLETKEGSDGWVLADGTYDSAMEYIFKLY